MRLCDWIELRAAHERSRDLKSPDAIHSIFRSTAMKINVNWDPSVLSAANARQIEAAVSTAARFFENTFVNPITITINVNWSPLGGNAVADNTNIPPWMDGTNSNSVGYSQLISAFKANASLNPVDAIAVAGLPASDPIISYYTGGPGPYAVKVAELKALGLYSPNSGEIDGSMTLNSGATWAWGSGQNGDDPVAAAEHEISEIMGRVGYSIWNWNTISV
jgi:hypothetical protein